MWYAAGTLPDTSQGWKLYVPIGLDTARRILEVVTPLLLESGAYFKYVRNESILRDLNAGLYGYSQVGKGLVIYVQAVDHDLVEELCSLLKEFTGLCPRVPYAKPIGGDLPLYYRYGSFIDTEIQLDGVVVPDDRYDWESAVPEGVIDWIRQHSRPASRKSKLSEFLTRFPVIGAIHQSGKGGLFSSFDIQADEFNELYMKVGYSRGQILSDGKDGADLVRNEIAFYRHLSALGISRVAPGVIDTFDDGRTAAIVMERLPGRSLLGHKSDGSLTVRHVAAAWELLAQLHDVGLFLGDAKLQNFVATGPSDIRVVDFELSGVIAKASLPELRTFELVNPAPRDVVSHDQAHFLVSALYGYGSSEIDHTGVVDVEALLAEPHMQPADFWAQKMLLQWRHALTLGNSRRA